MRSKNNVVKFDRLANVSVCAEGQVVCHVPHVLVADTRIAVHVADACRTLRIVPVAGQHVDGFGRSSKRQYAVRNVDFHIVALVGDFSDKVYAQFRFAGQFRPGITLSVGRVVGVGLVSVGIRVVTDLPILHLSPNIKYVSV
mgnify:CR=1 FL=1